MKFLQLPDNEKIDIVNQMKEQTKILQVVIEKDVWVTAVLKALFSTSCADFLVFKGGTSLPVRAFISIENSNIPQPNLRRRFTLNH